ncbi:DUF3149 domain-containing protein (plasmid) [Pseudomonas aeruginosa]|nr:DUF3149 domain-containing protein [Pseudomonas aeruginosa]CAI9912217.1 DUF3149 domain-containing protein [Pseudomonas aeruginosa]
MKTLLNLIDKALSADPLNLALCTGLVLGLFLLVCVLILWGKS